MEYSGMIAGAIIATVFFMLGFKCRDLMLDDDSVECLPENIVPMVNNVAMEDKETIDNNFKLKTGLYSYKKSVIVDDEVI